jgi:hypothetical protein
MPTVLLINGWRFYFYANESNEPIHIHCKKAEKECKYWLDAENFSLTESFTYNMNNRDKRDVKRLIFEHFEYIEEQWNNIQKGKNNE